MWKRPRNFNCKQPDCPADGVHDCPRCGDSPHNAEPIRRNERKLTRIRVEGRWEDRGKFPRNRPRFRHTPPPLFPTQRVLNDRIDRHLWATPEMSNDTAPRLVAIEPRVLLTMYLEGQLFVPDHIEPWSPERELQHIHTLADHDFLVDRALLGVFPSGAFKILVGHQAIKARLNYLSEPDPALPLRIQTDPFHCVLLSGLLSSEEFERQFYVLTQQTFGRAPTKLEMEWI